jgi:hypothetical protein
MKPNRDAAALAALLTTAAEAPLPLPVKKTPAPVVAAVAAVEEAVEAAPVVQAPREKKAAKVKIMADTVGITLRPERDLLHDYIIEAAERTKAEGRVISAQEIMLEVLKRGRPKVKK